MASHDIKIGVLALQGSFAEHVCVLRRLGGVETCEVRSTQDLNDLDGIVLPGGESSAMGIVENGDGSLGLFGALSEKIAHNDFPAYGTCAGLILLCERALCQKQGGQPLVGGLKATVCRNYFGAQIDSFEQPLNCEQIVSDESDAAPAVFIRAPAILELWGDAKPLASLVAKPCAAAESTVAAFFDGGPNHAPKKLKMSTENGKDANDAEDAAHTVIVAARQNNILVTAFHPELTGDTRWHRLFLSICREHKKK